ncbi:uncharacterized protein LOC100210754 isoform X2 [Hydra vulgaris]|uniref:uncharacterized protein LOC100210754 isoform X2 n=1 Tax=Hydra vulgaris TaxID=6087 RepID=UPI001F5FCDCF|nr:uncharacterized protein LOC100210754 isoform X2 [Hydra vulgaris]
MKCYPGFTYAEAVILELLNKSKQTLTCNRNSYKQVCFSQCAHFSYEFWSGHMKKIGEHAKPIQDQISEFSYMFGGKEFYSQFVRKRKPVVFRGVASDWMAAKQWKNESYLIEKYGDVLFDVEMGKIYDNNLNTRKTMKMKEFLSEYRNISMYLDSPFPQSEMIHDMQMPLMMGCEELKSAFTSMHLLFSNGGTSSPLHFDGFENFLTVFSGVKVVYLIDPNYIHNMYFKDIKTFPNLSPISPEGVDLVKYPLFASTPFHKLVLNAGDMAYIPQGWFHQVRSFESPNIGVSLWFSIFSPNQLLDINEPDYSYRDSLAQEEAFKFMVFNAPLEIECSSQKVNMINFDKIILPKVVNYTKRVKLEDVEKESFFVNNTVIYEKVELSQPTVFVGSDDRWIYAIDAQTGKIKWKVETANDTGSTCNFHNSGLVVYCGADDGYMRALDVTSGTVIWKFKTNASIISSAFVDHLNLIYFGSMDHYFYVLHSNGTLKWKKNLKSEIWSSPCLTNNSIFIATMSAYRSNIFALDKETGAVAWKYMAFSPIKASPCISHNGSLVTFCDTSSCIYSFNTTSGNITFLKKTASNDSIEATPVADSQGKLFILSKSGSLLALILEPPKVSWKLNIGNSDIGCSSSPYLGVNNILYIAGGNGTCYAIDPDSGEVKWKTDIGSQIFFSSPRLSKNVIYIGSLDGRLNALDSNTGKLLWSAHTNGPLVGTPLITRTFV